MGRRSRARKNYVPALYGALSMCLAIVVLPSALRPPPDSANTSGQLSPDAPPDQDADAIIQTISQAGSRTAGARTGADPLAEETEAAAGPGKSTTTTVKPVVSRSQCRGEPPRQVESVYSPRCTAAFVGDNGGATDTGVTASTINIGLICDCGSDGEVNDTSASGHETTRFMNALRKYFNQNFELYGRQLRFHVIGPGRTSPEQQQAAANELANVPVFAAFSDPGHTKIRRLADHQIPTITYMQLNAATYRELAPWVWESTLASDDAADFASDYLCKKLEGRRPFPTNDLSGRVDYNANRTFSLVAYEGPNQGSTDELVSMLRNRCGVTLKGVYTLDSATDVNRQSNVALQLYQSRASTVIFHADPFSATGITTSAEGLGYRPEWFITGAFGIDITTFLARNNSQAQWANAFGISLREVQRPLPSSECYRAARSMDGAAQPPRIVCDTVWPGLVQLIGAIQEAGPELTRQRLVSTIPRLPKRVPDAGTQWAMAGFYGPTDWSYSEYAAEIWYDPNKEDAGGLNGTYRFPNCARRYGRGEFTTDPPAVFSPDSVTGSDADARRCGWKN